MIKPRTPPGTLELLPREQIAFQRMLDVIRRNYERFGFLPVETPVFELSDVLLTKSGGETERQVYFVQSTGALANAAESGDRSLPEMALRFDLTVPLARYVAEHEHELTFPFRRYQIVPKRDDYERQEINQDESPIENTRQSEFRIVGFGIVEL